MQAEKELICVEIGSKEWYFKFHTFMQSHGFRRSDVDHYLYTKKAKDGSLILFTIYVDDMLIEGKSRYEIDALKMGLHKTFDMKDFGDANHILGMCIIHDKNKKLLYLSQKKYISKVLQHFNMREKRFFLVLHCLHM